MSIKQNKPSKPLNNDLSQLPTLWFNQGNLGFKTLKEGQELRVGDQVLLYPCISIDKYSVSDTKKRFLKHIIYDLYEFSFIPIAKYQTNDHPPGYYKFKDINHYLIELLPGFNVFHFNWKNDYKQYLKIGTLYKGYGRLSNCDNPAIYNPNIDAKAMKNIRCKGTILKMVPNLLMKEYRKYFSDDDQKKIRKYINDRNNTISYDDALSNAGYPENELKFNVNFSRFKDKTPSLQSTKDNKNNEILFYCIKML